MRETGDEARRHEQAVARGDRAEHVADGERGHQADEQRLARPGRREQREEGRTDDDAGGVGGDGVPGRGDVDPDAGRDVGQQAHRDELGRADGDAAQDQGEGREGGVAGLGHATCSAPAPPACIPARAAFGAMSHRVHTTCRMPRGVGGGPVAWCPGSAQPGSGPPDAEARQQRRGREVQRRLRPAGAARSCRPAGRPPAGCSPRSTAARGTGRWARPRPGR